MDMPRLINTRSDFEKFITDIQEIDRLKYALHNGPNPKWELKPSRLLFLSILFNRLLPRFTMMLLYNKIGILHTRQYNSFPSQ